MTTTLEKAVALHQNGNLHQAKQIYTALLEEHPDDPNLNQLLGLVHYSQGDLKQAVERVSRAIDLGPPNAQWWSNLGACYQGLGQYDRAAEAFRTALKVNPEQPDAMNNLGVVLKSLGDFSGAIKCLRRTVQIAPHSEVAHSNLLYSLTAAQTVSREELYAEYRRWDERHGQVAQLPSPPPWNHKQMRIGYVSCDLHNHPVARFLEPILRNHTQSVEIYLYAHVRVEDDTTHRLRDCEVKWRDIQNASDSEVAGQIRADEIDILVDLSGHTAYNRLKVFTYRPAPVQVTYLGYFGPTGMATMDYWLSDWSIHPPDTKELCRESILRLPRCWVAYAPPKTSPEPHLGLIRDHITFASFNDVTKLTTEVLDVWSLILKRVPSSLLRLQAKQYETGAIRERIASSFERRGVPASRIIFSGHTPMNQYLEAHLEVDIVLDPFPRTGGTTVIDALWMGVPVITLAGSSYVERIAHATLDAVACTDWSADSTEQYIEKAVAMAENAMLRAALRGTLRGRLRRSPLMDGKGLALAIEETFRAILTKATS